jgi:Leucine-rich repeat (LRR) protein
MILAVLDIIMENVPELTALDLFDNKLYALDNLSVMSVKFPKLKVLHIARNQIRDAPEGQGREATNLHASLPSIDPRDHRHDPC